jgi:hypothetical protein
MEDLLPPPELGSRTHQTKGGGVIVDGFAPLARSLSCVITDARRPNGS